MTKIKISEIHVGDCCSEISHYTVKEVTGATVKFNHVEGGEEVELSHAYVENLLQCAEQFHQEVKVSKLDTYWTAKQLTDAKNTTNKVGDLRQKGIRTIFEESVPYGDVFTVCFKKADKLLSGKAYQAKVDEAVSEAINKVEKARTSKKSVTEAAKEAIEELIKNPVLNYEVGEDRLLRGYRTQTTSIDGYYDCFDMDINALRPVNINQIKFYITKGVKYIVE